MATAGGASEGGFHAIVDTAKAAVNEIMKEELRDFEFEFEKVPDVCSKLSERVVGKLQSMTGTSYKIVACVSLLKRQGVSYYTTSCCLWDTKVDSACRRAPARAPPARAHPRATHRPRAQPTL